MEPFTLVLSAIAGPAMQALFTGALPDAKDWSGVVATVLQALMSERSTTERTLERIEQSIADGRAAVSGNQLRAGLDFLTEARADWCPPEQRDRLLHEALNRFRDASTSAVDPRSEVLAHWHIALVWMLNRSVPGTLSALDRARTVALRAALTARDDWTHPGEERFAEAERQTLTGTEQAWQRLIGLGLTERRRDAHRRLRKQLAEKITGALELTATVQATYAAIGRPAAECAAPALLTPLPATGDFDDFPEIAVPLSPAVSHVVFGYALTVHEARVTDLSSLSPARWRVDADVTVGGPAGGGEPVQVAITRLGAAAAARPRIALAYQRATVQALVALPEPRLLAGGAALPGNGLVRPPDGARSRGWLRLENTQQPDALTFRLWPSGRRTPHDQGLLAVYRLG